MAIYKFKSHFCLKQLMALAHALVNDDIVLETKQLSSPALA